MLREAAKPFVKLKTKILKSKFPNEIRLDAATVITDVPKFIKSHISTLEANTGKLGYLPYYDRLVSLLKHKT